MEAGQKHSCKVCGKTFSSGRSLGGHMRSHLSLASGDPPAAAAAAAAAAYGLRENPKKTRRFSDSIPDDASSPSRDKLCRECGRGFPSWNALFGHMRSHAGGRNSRAQVGEEEEDESLSDDEGVVALRRGRRGSRRVPAIPASWSSEECEKEQEDVAVSLMMLSRDSGSWSGVVGESSDKNSVVWEGKGVADEEFEIERGKMGSELGNEPKKAESEVLDDGVVVIADEDEEEEEEGVARMAKVDAFDAHVSELLELKGKQLNSSFAEVKRKGGFFQCGSEAELRSSSKNKKMKLGDGEGDHIARGGYQCATCKKSFQSYQALGGHRASYHKKLKSCLATWIDVGSENNSTETDATMEAEAIAGQGRVDHCNVGRKSSKGLKKKAKAHECPICYKVFPSGQALGGHKRSHLIVNAGSGSSSTVLPQTIVIQHQNQAPGMPNLIDLNLPAPVDEESTNTDGNVEFKQWWMGHDSKMDRYLGMFSG